MSPSDGLVSWGRAVMWCVRVCRGAPWAFRNPGTMFPVCRSPEVELQGSSITRFGKARRAQTHATFCARAPRELYLSHHDGEWVSHGVTSTASAAPVLAVPVSRSSEGVGFAPPTSPACLLA